MQNILKFKPFDKKHNEACSFSKKRTKQAPAFIDSNTFRKIQQNNHFYDLNKQDVSHFIDSWNPLDLDLCISDQGKSRTRKHATLTMNDQHKIILKNPHSPHFNSIKYNTL